MAKKSNTPAPEPSSSRRYALVAVVVVALVLVVLLFLWPSFKTKRWIADLHSDNSKTVAAARDQLLASDDEGLNDTLAETLRDPSMAFPVRVAVGQILLQRNRLSVVEAALEDPDLTARHAALAVLFSQVPKHGMDWFQRSYVQQDEEGMRETVRGWLRQDRDASRAHAVELASALDMKDALPLIRGLIVPTKDMGATRQQQRLLESAAKALLAFQDCEGVALFLKPALEEPADVIRLRMIQALYRGVRGPQPPCPDAVSEAELKHVLLSALGGGQHTRHGAMLLLRGEKAWSLEAQDQLLAILDEGTVGDFARRAALGALAETRDLVFAKRLPRYFHDPDQYVRSEAVTASRMYAAKGDSPVSFEGCWIGILENETENEFAFYGAMGGLRDAAGTWVGLPVGLSSAAAKADPEWVEFRKTLFEQGEAQGLSRVDWARTWFDRWTGRLGLEPDLVEQAWEARQAFWKARRAGDAAAAALRLEELDRLPTGGLSCYERGALDQDG